jgi:integrase
VRWKKIERNPTTGVVRPSAHKKELESIQPDGYEKYLNRVQGTRYYALGVFAADCGCRRGEQLALQWPDINPKSGVVTISKSVSETKAGLEIKVPKSPVVLDYQGDRIDPLQQLRGFYRSDEGIVVTDGHVNVAAKPVRIDGQDIVKLLKIDWFGEVSVHTSS